MTPETASLCSNALALAILAATCGPAIGIVLGLGVSVVKQLRQRRANRLKGAA